MKKINRLLSAFLALIMVLFPIINVHASSTAILNHEETIRVTEPDNSISLIQQSVDSSGNLFFEIKNDQKGSIEKITQDDRYIYYYKNNILTRIFNKNLENGLEEKESSKLFEPTISMLAWSNWSAWHTTYGETGLLTGLTATAIAAILSAGSGVEISLLLGLASYVVSSGISKLYVIKTERTRIDHSNPLVQEHQGNLKYYKYNNYTGLVETIPFDYVVDVTP